MKALKSMESFYFQRERWCWKVTQEASTIDSVQGNQRIANPERTYLLFNLQSDVIST